MANLAAGSVVMVRVDTVLLVEDDPVLRTRIEAALSERGFCLLVAGSAEDGLEQLRTHPTVDVAVCQFSLPNEAAMDFVSSAHDTYPQLPLVFLSPVAQPRAYMSARQLGVRFWVLKPFTDDGLELVVRRAMRGSGGGPRPPPLRRTDGLPGLRLDAVTSGRGGVGCPGRSRLVFGQE